MQAMVIILTLYLVLVWLVFSKLKLVRWGWGTGTVTVLLGAFILAVFVALLNYLTPSGRVVVAGRVVEVTPNVAGEVISIPVATNVPVRKGAVLFEIDPTPFQYKVKQLGASLAAAQQQAEQLKANYDQATANVEGLAAQLAFSTKRLADFHSLVRSQAATEFREQDTQNQVETTRFQLAAAKAAQVNAKIALDAEIDGVNPAVAQVAAQLDNAKWELSQTKIVAPGNGYVTVMALAVGDRAVQLRPALAFILTDEITIIGLFSPNGFQTIKAGAPVTLVFDNNPGKRFQAKVVEIPQGVGQGQIAISGTLARSNQVGGTKEFPAVISIPDDVDRELLRLGMPGNATVFNDNAGVIGIIASILIWISSYTAYL